MSQPTWKCIANCGDVNPIEHGGFFVYIDTTGVYPPEAAKLEANEGNTEWTLHRFVLEPCFYTDGILSDNQYHKDHPAWFAKPESERADRPQDTTYLSDLCDDITEEELVRLFCSDDPLERAQAWRIVGDYHGYENLDSYPLKLNRKEVWGRYSNLTPGFCIWPK